MPQINTACCSYRASCLSGAAVDQRSLWSAWIPGPAALHTVNVCFCRYLLSGCNALHQGDGDAGGVTTS